MNNNNLIGTENAGYIIVQQGRNAVIGQRNQEEFAAWHYKIENNKVNYFWGRYGSKDFAQKAFYKKENGIYSGN